MSQQSTEDIVVENVIDCRNIPLQTVYKVGVQTSLELRTYYTQTVIDNGVFYDLKITLMLMMIIM